MSPRLHRALASALLAFAAAAAASDLPVDAATFRADKEAWKAWSEVIGVESYAAEWQQTWTHPVKKAEVLRTLSTSLDVLRKAAERDPRNLDLQLAAGIAARFAHNLDVEGAAETGFTILKRAEERFPDDSRAGWQLGVSQCDAAHLAEGMEQLLAIEDRPLPVQYWKDYARCAYFSFMPLHALKAFDKVAKQEPLTGSARAMQERARELRPRADPSGVLPIEKAWHVEGEGADRRYQNWPCGFQLELTDSQKLGSLLVKDGLCMAQVQLGPYPTRRGDVFPSALIIVGRKGDASSLDDFMDRFEFLRGRKPASLPACPGDSCRAFQTRNPAAYPDEGGGLFLVQALERPEPALPGLIFERPRVPPRGEPGMHYYQPITHPVRYTGTLYYLIGLDTAVSVAEQAKSEFRRLLLDLVVE